METVARRKITSAVRTSKTEKSVAVKDDDGIRGDDIHCTYCIYLGHVFK